MSCTCASKLADLHQWAVAEAAYRRGRDIDRWLQMQRVIKKIEDLTSDADAMQCRLIDEYLAEVRRQRLEGAA